MEHTTVAFLCYDRHDDRDRSVSSFRESLTAALAARTSRPVEIFQDRVNIRWGENWRDRIRAALDETPVLVPIVTPNFLQSDECRDELECFLEGEDRRRRWDLILPVYFYPIRKIDDGEPIAGDYLIAELRRRQWQDWIEHRTDAPDSPRRLAYLGRLAADLLVAVDARPSAPAELRVGANEQYSTITAALNAARPWDRVVVAEGIYPEAVSIDRPVEIIGLGDGRTVVIESSADNVISVQADQGRIANLTVRHAGTCCSGIKVTNGRVVIEGNVVTSTGISCISIQGGAWPSIHHNRIHGGNQEGIYIGEGASGTIEDNDIYQNRFAGIAIRADANPKVRRNRIYNGDREGIYIGDHGRGLIDGNVVRENAVAGIHIERGGSPIVGATNRLYSNGPGGVVNLRNMNT
jgi:parallel beta-helix repeat protein